MKSKNANVHSDFWLGSFDVDTDIEGSNSVDTRRLIKLSMARRAVSNFVNILTNKSIPVIFNSTDQNMTDGKTVFLSADIAESKDFDPAVGLALHEGSHVHLTDFEVFHTIWQNIPRSLYTIAEKKGYSKSDVADYVKRLFNYVEDRFIDNFIYTTAPGYRGYYIALYDKYFHSDKISVMLKSEMFRVPTLDAYDARIINFTNPDTDLTALPGLEDISKVLDLNNISRLKTTSDRFDLSLKIAEIIYTNVLPYDQAMGMSSDESDDTTDGDGNSSGKFSKGGVLIAVETEKQSGDVSEEPSADDVLGGENTSINVPKPEDSEELKKKKEEVDVNKSGIAKSTVIAIFKALKKQKIFNDGQIKKKKVSAKENTMLEQLEQSGVMIVDVGMNIDSNTSTKGIECIVFKNVTKELLQSGTFPCVAYSPDGTNRSAYTDAVSKGIQLGTMLGRRLKIRNEINVTKYMRKSDGKIDRRVLSELGFDNETVFYKMDIDKFKTINLHISVDASSSMCGEKWTNTLTAVTAICKAASMIDNLNVTVSLRSTTNSQSKCLPCVGIVYNSKKDSFTKVRTMFPYLAPYGSTPEGLCYEAIMDYLNDSTADDSQYFLNFSDGQPAYAYSDTTRHLQYDYTTGGKHTRHMVNEIRKKGYKVMSYFIAESRYRSVYVNSQEESCFKVMYGTDAKFIDVTSIVGIAKTMNQLFLSKT